MQINLAVSDEINPIMSLVLDAIQKMHSEGVAQWGELYPTREIFLEDIAAHSLYTAWVDGVIVGIIGLDEKQFSEWEGKSWVDTNGKPLAVHRLCVNTAYQGQGISKKLMRFAEEYALENGFSSIRLDAFTGNQISVGLYDSLGYKRRGTFNVHGRSCYCFEKVL